MYHYHRSFVGGGWVVKQFTLSFTSSPLSWLYDAGLILCKLHFSFAIWLPVTLGQSLGIREKLKDRSRKKELAPFLFACYSCVCHSPLALSSNSRNSCSTFRILLPFSESALQILNCEHKLNSVHPSEVWVSALVESLRRLLKASRF